MAKLRVNKIAAPIVKDEFTGSVHFDGSGDYLSIPDSTDFSMGTGDFTLEGWFYFNATGTNRLFGQRNSSAAESQFLGEFYNGHTVAFFISIGDTNYPVSKTNIVSLHTWHHIAVTRLNQVLHLYVDGVLQSTNTTTGSLDDRAQPFVIGRQGNYTGDAFNGYISNFRICKGHAVYDGNFTPPTRELEVHTKAPKGVVFPAADNRTVLLACQDAYNPLTEATGRHTITGAGNLGGVPGQELVPNGDFVTDVSGWTALNSTTSVSSGQVTITNSGASNGRLTSTAFDTVVGARYALKYRAITSGGSYRAEIRESNGLGSEQSFLSTTDYSTETFFFTATHTQHTVVLYSIGADGVATIYDYVSVSAVHPVTDANPGLLRKTNTTSTITETTGSVYFSGATLNRLTIEPTSDFAFGTGDFTIEMFVYHTSLTGQQTYFGDTYGGGSGADGIYTYKTTNNEISLYDSAQRSLSAQNVIKVNTWHHVAWTRENGTLRAFLDGIKVDEDTYTGDFTTTQYYIGDTAGTSSGEMVGYISNLRVCKGHAVYTSNFIPPSRELEVHEGPDNDRTVLLACYDGENIFADKTGRHIISAHGARTSSSTPTSTDSPIGSTTVTPGLTREVDPTEGPTFGGGAGFVSQNWLTLPKGTTTERMPNFGKDQSGTRGFFAGAYSPTRSDVINYVTVPTLGNAIDFGNLGAANGGMAGFSDNTRGWAVGGNIAPTRTNVMEYVTMASSGNAIDGGDLITATQSKPGSVANSIRGIVAGGATPGQVKTIVHHTIQTTGIVQNFGDLTEAKQQLAGVMSPTRGVFAGGKTPSLVDTIEYVTMASTGNAVLFGELSLDDRAQMGGASNTVRGLFGGGRNPGDFTHIEYITMATLGDAVDFGDLTQSSMDGDVGAVSNSTRVVFGGGGSDELGHVEIATLGNTTQFGKFTVQTTANQDPACFSSGHGGLG
jgi:hypothetical protein